MGCTESLPEVESYARVHPCDPLRPGIGVQKGAGPSVCEPIKIIVAERLFSWSGDSFDIMHVDGSPFGNGFQVQGRLFALRGRMALLEGNGQMQAVCLRVYDYDGQTFKVYVPNPVFPGQKPSTEQDYKGSPLYAYCKVVRIPYRTEQSVYLIRPDGKTNSCLNPDYTITRAGGYLPKKRLVKKGKDVAAMMEGGTWVDNLNTYQVTINPGIDPCLIVCLCAICDEMDEASEAFWYRY